MKPVPTAAQKAKLAQRLALKHDRSDHGQLLPLTEAALLLPDQTTLQQAQRAVALASALVSERLVVPVPVEVHPAESGEHRPQPLGEQDQIPLATVDGPHGPTVLAFSSAAQLAAWDAKARPMTMSAQRVAVAATQMSAPPSILIDAASDAPVTLPVGAVHALIGGDTWLPPWEDESLVSDALAAAGSQCEDVVDIRVTPFALDGQRWNGTIQITLSFLLDGNANLRNQKESLANALVSVSELPRLRAAAPEVNLLPTPVVAI